MNPRLIWPITVIGIAVVCGIVALTLADKDVTALAGFGLAVLGGLVYGKLDQVKDLANGNIARLHSMVETLTQQLAESNPVPKK